MQAQPISPYAEATGAQEQQGVHTGPEHATGADEHALDSPKKKSMIEKVKDKAKKLKTKMKKPKSSDATDNNDESSSSDSSEDESGSEPQQQVGNRAGDEREVVVTPGLQGDAFEAIPDPHVSGVREGTAGVEERFGHMSLGDKSDTAKLQEEVPSAPGQVSAGVAPYLASHNLDQSPYVSEGGSGISVEEGKNVEGKDLLATPTSTDPQETTATDYEKTPEVSKTSDNSAAWYTPTSKDKASEEEQQQKPLTDRVAEGLAATAAASAGALGVKSLSDGSENVEGKGADASGSEKSMLEQAKERIFGTSTKTVKGEKELPNTSESNPTITERATNLKDTIAAKLGYGSTKNLTGEGDNSAAALEVDAHDPNKSISSEGEGVEEGAGENKSYTQKAYDAAYSAKDAVAAKLGYGSTAATESPATQGEQKSVEEGAGENKSPATQGEQKSVEEGAGENKSYTQKAYDAAYSAKDAVAAKLGYGSTAATESSATQGEQKSYLQGAKDAVGSKLGYANRNLSASTEGAYNEEQNVPASTAARFHPGEEDRALSELITEKMSTGAATVKDTLMRPFGASKSAPTTPTTTPPPSSAAAVAEDPVHNTVTGTHDVGGSAPYMAGEEKPGIVGKVTGAVTSLLGTSGSGKKRADEATGKAKEDSQAAGV